MCRMIHVVQNKCDNDIHLQNNEIHKVKPIMNDIMSKAARPHELEKFRDQSRSITWSGLIVRRLLRIIRFTQCT